MKAGEIAASLEAFAPLALQESWDNAGFCIGHPAQEVHGIMLGLDCTERLMDEALERGADMIVTHHPLIFRGIKRIDPTDPTGRLVYRAIRHGLVVYAAHTNADKVCSGVSGRMADLLGLEDRRMLEPDTRTAGGEPAGLGMVGELSRPMDPEAFVAWVKECFGLSSVRTSSLPSGPVRRVALCGGSGAGLIGAALAAGADAYVSGDISYHHFFCPEDLLLMDIGHFESEYGIVGRFFEILRENFPNFAVHISERENNPVNYY